jgi:hypothetical protein
MNTELAISKGLSPILHWMGKQIVDEVPSEIALCEFDCDKTQCTLKEWKACPRRLRKAPGE